MLVLVAYAAIAADCQDMREAAFRARVDEARQALLDYDSLGYGAVFRAFQAEVACMIEPIPSDAWAQMLVTEAIVEQAVGQPWQEPLRAALAIDPASANLGSPEIRSYV